MTNRPLGAATPSDDRPIRENVLIAGKVPLARRRYASGVLAIAFLLALRLAPSGTGEYKQPQLAASDKLIAMTFGSGDRIYYSSSTDGGKAFAKPVKVAKLPVSCWDAIVARAWRSPATPS